MNARFEHRFGYTRYELIGRTSTELGFWEDPDERVELIEKLRDGAQFVARSPS